MRLSLLVLDGVFDSGLSLVRDALETAAHLAQRMGREPPFEVTEVGVRRHAVTRLGRRVTLAPAERTKADVVFVPGLAATRSDDIEKALGRSDVLDALPWLQACAKRGAHCVAACSGTFLLGEAGLLDGLKATTTWWLAPAFRRRYPSVLLDEAQMLVSSGRILTAGAAMAHLDAALALVHRKSPKLARAAAESLAIEPRASQAPFIVPSFLAASDPLVERFESWARAHLERRFSVPEAARAIGTSPRTLERKVRKVLGRSPLALIQDIRVERATQLLRTRQASLDEAAAEVGYESGVTLGALIRQRLGRGVREMRRAK